MQRWWARSGTPAMIGEAAAIGSAVAFGISTVLARRFMDAIPPESGVLVSITTNVVVFSTIAAVAAARSGFPPIHPASIPLFVLGGLAGTLVGRNLTYVSIEVLGAPLSTTIRLSAVAFTLLFGLVFLKELPRPWQLVGLTVITIALWICVWSRGRGAPSGGSRSTGSGLLLALAGGAGFAVGDTVRRGALVLTPAPVLGAAVGACAALTGHLLWSRFRASARWPRGPALRRPDLLGSAAFNTIAILLLFVALGRAPVAIVSVLYNLQVLVVFIVSPLLLRGQEPITAWLVLGTALALAGTTMILMG
ncbi:MAG: EamA family transporter [Armatimonadota bacterium]